MNPVFGGRLTAPRRPNQPKLVRSLEKIARNKYLELLEDACAGYVKLLEIKTLVLKQVRENILRTLKNQLEQNLTGILSSVVRQEMIGLVLSGNFPSEKYINQFYGTLQHLNLPSSDPDKIQLNLVIKKSKDCVSVCCTGAFIIEAMLTVLVNSDVRNLRFEAPISQTYVDRGRFLRKYVPLQLPAVLAHYEASVAESESTKVPKLESLIVKNTHIVAGPAAHARNQAVHVLSAFEKTSAYLQIPGQLSAASAPIPEFGLQYLGISEHLMLIIGNLFQGLNRFERLQEIVLGAEACNTLLGMKTSSGKNVTVSLFRGIGFACPNLKSLDLSQAIAISGDSLVHLFFHDAYSILHQFVYQPKCEIESEQTCQVPHKPYEEVLLHDLSRYCPWCMDQWCPNRFRGGLEFSDCRTPIVDDRLYNLIKILHQKKASRYLINVLKVSDLVKSLDASHYELVRPEPCPGDLGFVAPDAKPSYYETDYEGNKIPWYPPQPDQVRYQPPTDATVLQQICKSLQFLYLSSSNFHANHELIPFLLKVMPNLRSLGYARVVDGLKMIRDLPELSDSGIVARNLENLYYTFDWAHSCSYDKSWAHEDIQDQVEDFCLSSMVIDNVTDETMIGQLGDELMLIATVCPNLKNICINLPGGVTGNFLKVEQPQLWRPLGSHFLRLRDLTLNANSSFKINSLLEVLGPRLTSLHLMLGKISDLDTSVDMDHDGQEQDQLPKLDVLLSFLSNIELLNVSFSSGFIDISPAADITEKKFEKIPSLTLLSIYTPMTKRAFCHIWSRAVHLESIHIAFPFLRTFGAVEEDLDEFSQSEVINLLKSNRMRKLRFCQVVFPVKNISAASTFIEGMSHTLRIMDLMVSVRLPQETYATDEQLEAALAETRKSMDEFKKYCRSRAADGCYVRCKWNRTGVLDYHNDPDGLENDISFTDDDLEDSDYD